MEGSVVDRTLHAKQQRRVLGGVVGLAAAWHVVRAGPRDGPAWLEQRRASSARAGVPAAGAVKAQHPGLRSASRVVAGRGGRVGSRRTRAERWCWVGRKLASWSAGAVGRPVTRRTMAAAPIARWLGSHRVAPVTDAAGVSGRCASRAAGCPSVLVFGALMTGRRGPQRVSR
ncbi:unnamed protein product [Phytophthora fragariaefolia]|uniref:Unnamed protein product n=1 Tax=Phytophthora fragariaefolia TaxID=1490495 RepID=A0A9W6YLX8_9STRA|nr:unnamed protein product [Phytophthora fragariaefolia]